MDTLSKLNSVKGVSHERVEQSREGRARDQTTGAPQVLLGGEDPDRAGRAQGRAEHVITWEKTTIRKATIAN